MRSGLWQYRITVQRAEFVGAGSPRPYSEPVVSLLHIVLSMNKESTIAQTDRY